MKIYTKDGDDGFARWGDGRLRKSDPRYEAIGSVDELGAQLGMCLRAVTKDQPREIPQALGRALDALYAIGSLLAGAGPERSLPGASVGEMERWIDAIAADLPPLRGFTRPGGCELASRLHVARAVARRAERAVVRAIDEGLSVPAGVLPYLNRLSDLLFTLARLADHAAGAGDEPIRR